MINGGVGQSARLSQPIVLHQNLQQKYCCNRAHCINAHEQRTTLLCSLARTILAARLNMAMFALQGCVCFFVHVTRLDCVCVPPPPPCFRVITWRFMFEKCARARVRAWLGKRRRDAASGLAAAEPYVATGAGRGAADPRGGPRARVRAGGGLRGWWRRGRRRGGRRAGTLVARLRRFAERRAVFAAGARRGQRAGRRRRRRRGRLAAGGAPPR